jgi:hypothetical protein
MVWEDVEQPIKIITMGWHAKQGPLETSFEYFYNQKQDENREKIAVHPNDPDWNTACWILKNSLTHILIEDRLHGPFPLCHLDLHSGNMLFDDEYNLKAIIDWSSAQAAPLEQLSVSPDFAIAPVLSDEENQPTIELKALVVGFLKEMKSTRMPGPPLDDPSKLMPSTPSMTALSTYLASKSAEIALRHYMASPRGALFGGKMIANLIYGDNVTWEQLKEVYGAIQVF